MSLSEVMQWAAFLILENEQQQASLQSSKDHPPTKPQQTPEQVVEGAKRLQRWLIEKAPRIKKGA